MEFPYATSSDFVYQCLMPMCSLCQQTWHSINSYGCHNCSNCPLRKPNGSVRTGTSGRGPPAGGRGPPSNLGGRGRGSTGRNQTLSSEPATINQTFEQYDGRHQNNTDYSNVSIANATNLSMTEFKKKQSSVSSPQCLMQLKPKKIKAQLSVRPLHFYFVNASSHRKYLLRLAAKVHFANNYRPDTAYALNAVARVIGYSYFQFVKANSRGMYYPRDKPTDDQMSTKLIQFLTRCNQLLKNEKMQL